MRRLTLHADGLLYNDEVLYVAPLSDMHLGLRNVDERMLKRWIEVLCRSKVLAFTLGDTTDCVSYKDKRFHGAAVADWLLRRTDDLISAQVERAAKVLAPLVEAGCLAALCYGNHEEKVARQGDVDPHKMLVDALGATEATVWRSGQVPVDGGISFRASVMNGKRPVTSMYAFHGVTSGSKPRKVQKLTHLVARWAVNLVVLGHGHEPTDTAPVRLYGTGPKQGRGLMCAAWLKEPDNFISYAESKGYEAQLHGPTLVRINVRTGDVEAVFFGEAAFNELRR